MDIDSNRVLYEKNANEKRLIASTTKIMTALLALESNKMDNLVEAKEEILKMYGTSIYLSLHEKMKLRDLVYGLMLRSGNDAAIVIATYLSGSEEEFVKKMNKKAKEIGMVNTTFQNAHGLDEETKNYSTAHDMALLSSYVYKNFKEYRTITKTYDSETIEYSIIPIKIYKLLCEQACKNAEPGIIFEDRHNNYSPDSVYEDYKFISTNPCFHPDTLISTEYGLKKIKDITIPMRVYSMDSTGKLVMAQAHPSFISKKNARTLKVTLKNI